MLDLRRIMIKFRYEFKEMIYFLSKNINLDLHPFKNFKLLFKEYPDSVLWTQWTSSLKNKSKKYIYNNDRLQGLVYLIEVK